MNIMLQKGIVWDSRLTACHCKLKLKLNRAFSVNTLIVVEVKLLLQAR